MLIVYAIMGSGSRAWLFYLDVLIPDSQQDLAIKRSKNELKFMFDECEDNKFRFRPSIEISGKRKTIEATLTWAENEYNNADKSKYLTCNQKSIHG